MDGTVVFNTAVWTQERTQDPSRNLLRGRIATAGKLKGPRLSIVWAPESQVQGNLSRSFRQMAFLSETTSHPGVKSAPFPNAVTQTRTPDPDDSSSALSRFSRDPHSAFRCCWADPPWQPSGIGQNNALIEIMRKRFECFGPKIRPLFSSVADVLGGRKAVVLVCLVSHRKV